MAASTASRSVISDPNPSTCAHTPACVRRKCPSGLTYEDLEMTCVCDVGYTLNSTGSCEPCQVCLQLPPHLDFVWFFQCTAPACMSSKTSKHLRQLCRWVGEEEGRNIDINQIFAFIRQYPNLRPGLVITSIPHTKHFLYGAEKELDMTENKLGMYT